MISAASRRRRALSTTSSLLLQARSIVSIHRYMLSCWLSIIAPENAPESDIGFTLSMGEVGRGTQCCVHTTFVAACLPGGPCWTRDISGGASGQLALSADRSPSAFSDRVDRKIRHLTTWHPRRPLGEVFHIDAVSRGKADEA